MPDITFLNSPKTEEERLKMTAKVIASGFYEKQGFVVIPELDKRVAATSQVIYPSKLEYQKIEIEEWAKEWRRVEAKFWEYLEELVPSARLHGPIEIRVTRYGTVASAARLGMVPHQKAIYYLRRDVDISQLAAMIINNILYYDRKHLGITWTKREALMDFIMTRPKMKKLFPHFEPVFAQLSRIPKKIREESREYVRSLGLARQQVDFEIAGGKVIVVGKVIGREITKQEIVVLKLLVNRLGDLVTYDELADEIWGEGEFKSFWALNKVLERLRLKLVVMGIEGSRLESVRGQGYLLR